MRAKCYIVTKEEKEPIHGNFPLFLENSKSQPRQEQRRLVQGVLASACKQGPNEESEILKDYLLSSCIQSRACEDLIAGQWELHRSMAQAQILALGL